MNGVKKFFLNALILSCASIIMRAISVSFNIFVSNKIGAEAMGLITLTTSVYGLAITLATSGINLAVVRLVSASISKNDGNTPKIMRSAFIYASVFSLSAGFILFISAKNIGAFVLDDIRTASSLKLLSFTLFPIAISSVLNGYFYAVRRVYKNVIVQFCENGVKIGFTLAFLFILAPWGMELACISVIAAGAIAEVASLIINVILFFFDRRIHSRNESKSLEKSGFFDKIFFAAFPLGVSAYVRAALSTVEHLAIPWGLKKSGASASSALSNYGILHGMVFPVLLFPSCVLNSFSSLLVPELSASLAQKNTARISHIVSKVFSFSLLFSIAVSGIFISFSYEIGYFLYGSYEAGEFIKLLSSLIPLMYLDGAVDAMLKGLGEQLYTMRVNIADSLISVVLIVALLPSFGIKGYIGVIFITELLNTSLSIVKLLDITKIKTPVLKWVFKPLLNIIISTFITKAIFIFTPISKLSTILEISVTAIIYLLLSRLFGAISSDDIEWGKRIISKEKPS
ncbi:MAG: polysaccharide biosynthesis protein [Clostridia bacterium]|nr:polysaccharide biosynthesis protein [Clostridia bacterium]